MTERPIVYVVGRGLLSQAELDSLRFALQSDVIEVTNAETLRYHPPLAIGGEGALELGAVEALRAILNDGSSAALNPDLVRRALGIITAADAIPRRH